MQAGFVFIVHVWRDAHGFHASARDVSHERSDEFDDPDALARFLAALVGPPRGDAPPSFEPTDKGEASS